YENLLVRNVPGCRRVRGAFQRAVPRTMEKRDCRNGDASWGAVHRRGLVGPLTGDGDMDRRSFVGLTAATTATSLLSRTAVAQTAPKAKNVVLVHGLFADGSSWSEVIPRLQAAGLNVTSVQNPLTTLPEAVDAATRVLARQDGPTVLAGHSFSGM